MIDGSKGRMTERKMEWMIGRSKTRLTELFLIKKTAAPTFGFGDILDVTIPFFGVGFAIEFISQSIDLPSIDEIGNDGLRGTAGDEKARTQFGQRRI